MSLDRPGLQSDPSSRGDGDTHLLHQQVDVPLGVIQHVAVGLAQARQRLLHRPAVDVDPAGGAGGQELPVHGAGSLADQAHGTAHGRHPSPKHSLVHCIHQGGDPGLASVAQLLTGLPEAEVLSWGSRHQVRPTTGCWAPGGGAGRGGGVGQAAGWGLLTTGLFPEKVHEVGPSHGVFQELPEAKGPLLHAEPGGHGHAGGGQVDQSGRPVRSCATEARPGSPPCVGTSAPLAHLLTWVHSWPSRHHRL